MWHVALNARLNGSRRSVVAHTADSAAAGSATAQLFIATTWAAAAACGSGALVVHGLELWGGDTGSNNCVPNPNF